MSTICSYALLCLISKSNLPNICGILDGEPTLLEANDARWLNKEELTSVNWLPADLIVIKKLQTSQFHAH